MTTIPVMTEHLSTDYLVIGCGAMGMAFVDTLLDENPKADIIMIDRYAKPGGHWNMAYPFVTLHQPSAYYGCLLYTSPSPRDS